MGAGGSKGREDTAHAGKTACVECTDCERDLLQKDHPIDKPIINGGGDVKSVECLDCDKSTQRDLPSESSSSEGMPCDVYYQKVTECMKRNDGQIAPCTREWGAFKICHEEERNQQGSLAR
uniref:CHCH domain-containing protein n=1 Tax=Pseudictyota dubia TaxID=2749911 RepID=A0A7R9YXE3_9STRA|mmetsp:Transcript_13211/g.24611  ORF Transcript_13211/g.24611 Transcript_13211/m.24611 type:complete len:121 (+) Transcript_13211:112-474(+)